MRPVWCSRLLHVDRIEVDVTDGAGVADQLVAPVDHGEIARAAVHPQPAAAPGVTFVQQATRGGGDVEPVRARVHRPLQHRTTLPAW